MVTSQSAPGHPQSQGSLLSTVSALGKARAPSLHLGHMCWATFDTHVTGSPCLSPPLGTFVSLTWTSLCVGDLGIHPCRPLHRESKVGGTLSLVPWQSLVLCDLVGWFSQGYLEEFSAAIKPSWEEEEKIKEEKSWIIFPVN